MKRVIAALAVSAALLAALIVSGPAQASTGPRAVTAWLSTYDWWNNSPPGAGIEYPGLHQTAGGTGTYTDPVTFASQPSELRPGTRIYIPRFRKYFIKEDACAGCYTPPTWQFDLWIGGETRAQDASQDPRAMVNLWRRAVVIIRPPRGEPVSTAPLRDARA